MMCNNEFLQKTEEKENVKIIKALCYQAILGEEFRNSKKWFIECRHPNKI
jgi:hypothetical protein